MYLQAIRMLAVVAASGWLAQPVRAVDQDWPRWRGPRGDGTWRAPRLPERWPQDGLKAIWRMPIGPGFSGVVVADGLVYTMDRPEPTDNRRNPDGAERVIGFDAESGQIIWTHEYPAHYGDLDYGNGPRASPTVFDGRIYTLGAVGQLCCLDAKNGRVIWEREMVRQTDAQVPEWGFAASPLIIDGLVIVHTGARPNGCLIAFDRTTGEEVWRSLPDSAGYCTPLYIDSPSGPQLVIWTPENVHGLNPKSGEVYWSVPYKVTYGVSIATPIYHDGIVLVTGYWEGSKAIELGARPQDARLLWQENRHLRGLMAPPLFRDGYVYSIDKRFGLTCCALRTGEKIWDAGNRMTPKGRNPQATFVWAGGENRVLVLNSDGELILARFDPSGYHEDSRAPIIGQTWASPALAGDSVYARSDTEIIRVRIAAP